MICPDIRRPLDQAKRSLKITTYDHQSGPSAGAVLGETRYRDWPGRTSPGGSPLLHQLDRYVETELILAETSEPGNEAAVLPIDEWQFDPEDGPRYEASLRSLLGAVEILEEGSDPRTEGPVPRTEGW
jgi:hypothetical protein